MLFTRVLHYAAIVAVCVAVAVSAGIQTNRLMARAQQTINQAFHLPTK